LPESWRAAEWADGLARVSFLDTHFALIVLNLSIVLPYAIWLIKGFVDALPFELEEAAVVDGSTDFQTLRYVVAPLIIPGIIVAAVFSFIMCWNEFLFALVMTGRNAETLQITLHATNGARGIMWEQMSAVGALIMIPILVMSLTIRNYFVEGLTMGAVK
jgi:multiple sugar transport system permease protein